MDKDDSRARLFEQLRSEAECLEVKAFLESRGGVRPLAFPEVFLFLGHPRVAIPRELAVSAIFSHHFGAPAVVAKLEELRAKGLRNLTVLGHGAWLKGDLVGESSHEMNASSRIVSSFSEGQPRLGQWVQVGEALSFEGTSFFYGTKWGQCLTAENLGPELKLPKVRVASTDALFRETPSFLDFLRNQGVQVLDMESSAILSWAFWRQIPTRIFLHLSDSFEANLWRPHRWSLEATEMQELIQQLGSKI